MEIVLILVFDFDWLFRFGNTALKDAVRYQTEPVECLCTGADSV
jgi:hypothetical protein